MRLIDFMTRCLITIVKTIQDYKLIASTIDVLFWNGNYDKTDYVKVVRYDKEDINFYKKDYNEIFNSVNSANERIELIADYLQNKVDTPLQGLLFI